MAADRLFHKRLGHSEKLSQLSDFEYIVWCSYILSADDYGVMRLSAVTLQADHDRLAAKNVGAVERALRRSISVGLIQEFKHQNRTYVYQPDWQEFQKVRYPGKSHNPIPPTDTLSALTVELFSERVQELSLKGENDSGDSVREIRKKSLGDPDLSHGDGDVHANGNAHVNGNEEKKGDDRFDAFWAAYPNKKGKDAARKVWAKRKPSQELTDRILAALEWQSRSIDWLRDNSRYIPNPATYLNEGRWQDEPKAQSLLSDNGLANRAAGEEAERLILEQEARRHDRDRHH